MAQPPKPYRGQVATLRARGVIMTEREIEELREHDELEDIQRSALVAVLVSFLAVIAGTFLIVMILSGLKEAICQM